MPAKAKPTVELLDAPLNTHGGRRENTGRKPKAVQDATAQSHIEQKAASARLESAKADLAELEFLRQSGDWIPRDEVRTQVATAFAAISQTLRSIPDNLERKLALQPEVAEAVGKLIDESLDGLADTLEAMVEKEYA